MPEETITISDDAAQVLDDKAAAAGITRRQYLEAQASAQTDNERSKIYQHWFRDNLTVDQQKAIYDANQ